MEVTPDPKGDGTLEVTAGNLLELERVHLVDEIDGTPESILYQALYAPGVPRYGDEHPYVAGLYVVNQRVEPRGGRAARVVSNYAIPEEDEDENSETGLGTAELSSFTILQPNVFRDAFGQPMWVYYNGEASDHELDSWLARVDYPYTGVRASLTRVESSSRADVIRWMPNTVNSEQWSGDPAYTWKLESVRSSPIQKRQRWMVYYDFIFDPNGHKVRGEYQRGGTLPNDATEPSSPGAGNGNGIAYFDVLPAFDFNVLGIEVPRV